MYHVGFGISGVALKVWALEFGAEGFRSYGGSLKASGLCKRSVGSMLDKHIYEACAGSNASSFSDPQQMRISRISCL